MTKEIYEEIKSLLEKREELERKEIMLTLTTDEIYLAERKYSNVGCIPLNYEEISVLKKFITEKLREIEKRLKELGYYD